VEVQEHLNPFGGSICHDSAELVWQIFSSLTIEVLRIYPGELHAFMHQDACPGVKNPKSVVCNSSDSEQK
jgi:hypothetical protein